MSVHGAWVHLNWLQSELLKLGEDYRLELWPRTREELVCVAVVRHVNRYGAGLEIREELPVPGQDSLPFSLVGSSSTRINAA